VVGTSNLTAAVVHTEDISVLTERLGHSTLQEAFELVDTVEEISTLIHNILLQPTTPPALFIDLEGVNLSREGSISTLQIHIAPQNKSYLVDVHTLGSKAFDTSDKLDNTLRSVLQSELVPKVFFDVRNDSDALYSHFHISLAGVIDLQVMEFATRNFRGKFGIRAVKMH